MAFSSINDISLEDKTMEKYTVLRNPSDYFKLIEKYGKENVPKIV